MNNKFILVSLDASIELAEKLVDWLLEFNPNQPFNSYEINVHHTHHAKLNLLEQVTGRQTQTRFEITLLDDEYRLFLDLFRQDFNGSGIRLSTSPLLGHDTL